MLDTVRYVKELYERKNKERNVFLISSLFVLFRRVVWTKILEFGPSKEHIESVLYDKSFFV